LAAVDQSILGQAPSIPITLTHDYFKIQSVKKLEITPGSKNW